MRNLAFCTAVQSYGVTQPFKKSEFSPDQEVLLYAEVENLAADPTPKGFHTALKSNYQIFDSQGHRVADHEFGLIEEYCQNSRRDYFIYHRFRMPKPIYPGKYSLQLTVEDTKGHKVGQSTIDFTAKAEDRQRRSLAPVLPRGPPWYHDSRVCRVGRRAPCTQGRRAPPQPQPKP